MLTSSLPLPPFFDPEQVGKVWTVPYNQRASQAQQWAQEYHLLPSSTDKIKACLLIIDAQNTFCLPEFELYVQGAIADNHRLCEFIYRHLSEITTIIPTLDTHSSAQIFHPIFWVNAAGENPPPLTIITPEDVTAGTWQINPQLTLSIPPNYGLDYVSKLTQAGKYPLTIWPYHSLLGGIGHALVSSLAEAIFFHGIARRSCAQFELKGTHPLTENYSVFRPEVEVDSTTTPNTRLINQLLEFDKIFIAGQAKSHCVAWTVEDLLTEILHRDPHLATKVYLLEDCTSPVVVEGVVDFTTAAAAAYQRFAQAGMQVITSTDF